MHRASPRSATCPCALLATVLAVTALATPAPEATRGNAWTPAAFAAEATVELTTQAADEAPHTFPVWLVVVDDQVYVRLGSRAAARVERNRSAPLVGVTVAGRHFERVRTEAAPDMAQRVAEAIAAKYWSDAVIRWLPHPLTLRLAPP